MLRPTMDTMDTHMLMVPTPMLSSFWIKHWTGPYHPRTGSSDSGICSILWQEICLCWSSIWIKLWTGSHHPGT